MIFKQTATW